MTTPSLFARRASRVTSSVNSSIDAGSSTLNATLLLSGTLPGTRAFSASARFSPGPILKAGGIKSNQFGGRADVGDFRPILSSNSRALNFSAFRISLARSRVFLWISVSLTARPFV